MNNTTFIYALTDPETGACRYIGKSKDPRRRLWAHEEGDSSPRGRWVNCLKQRGLSPLMELLDEVPDDQWEFCEKEYIKLFRILSIPLLNVSDGGAGCDHHTDETRLKLSEARRRRPPASAETREKLSVLHKGNQYLLGKKRSIESRLKQGAKMKGRKHLLGFKHTAETKLKMSQAGSRKVWTDAHRANLSIACKLREQRKKLLLT